MSYLHIKNLRKADHILAFKKCFAMEKIHGTSAHVFWREGKVGFFSGGESHDRFSKLFDAEKLAAIFAEKFTADSTVIVYGEAYGGKQQGMSATYGKELKFVAFEVKIGERFLSVPQAAGFVGELGLEFVDFVEIEATIDAINAERDKPSAQAARNGIVEPKIREGVVLRPPFELTTNNGHRVIAKHKRAEFAERGSPNLDDLDPTRRVLMESAEAIAEEWVTPVRLDHVIDRLISERDDKEVTIKDTGSIISLMVEDVTREASGEIVDNPHVRRAISSKAAKLFKQKLEAQMGVRISGSEAPAQEGHIKREFGKKLKIRAFRDFVWIRPEKFEVSKGGIIIPDSGKDETNPAGGVVVAVGDGLVEGGRVIPLTVKCGDYVRHPSQSGTLVKLGDETFFVTRENQLFGAIE